MDIAAFDIELCPAAERWTALRQGGPEALLEHSDRSLLICYPDEASAGPGLSSENESSGSDGDENENGRGGSMAASCLQHHTGDTIVHIGELLFETVCRPSPWGRTSKRNVPPC